MLPERLSNGLCSLRPNEDKLVFSAIFKIELKFNEPDANAHLMANIIDVRFAKCVINSGKRYTYEQAQEVIENGNDLQVKRDEFDDAILIMDEIAKALRRERFRHGAVSFEKKDGAANEDAIFCVYFL